MVPAGYMAKRVVGKPDWLESDNVFDIYSVSSCVSEDFTDYMNYWKHNGHWLFDSPDIIEKIANDNSIDMDGVKFFYYEIYELEYDERGKQWREYVPDNLFVTNVKVTQDIRLEGFDIVSFSVGNSAECSPLSCNGLADEIDTNQHCLLSSLENAKQCLESGLLEGAEPGPYRIFAVYSLG